MEEGMIEILLENTDKNFQMKSHSHNCYEIIFIRSGGINIEISGKSYHLTDGSIVFLNKFESHSISVASYPYSRYFFLVSPGFLYRVLDNPVLLSVFKQRPKHFRHAITLEPAVFKTVDGIFGKMLDEYTTKGAMWEQALGALLHLLVLEIYRYRCEAFPAASMNSAMDIVVNVQSYIENHYTETVNLDDVSRKFHINMYYLSRLFSRYTGYTFKEYLTLQRISNARDLLRNTSCTVTRVCMDSGFNNVNHFIRTFKKHEGVTPFQYRKKRFR